MSFLKYLLLLTLFSNGDEFAYRYDRFCNRDYFMAQSLNSILTRPDSVSTVSQEGKILLEQLIDSTLLNTSIASNSLLDYRTVFKISDNKGNTHILGVGISGGYYLDSICYLPSTMSKACFSKFRLCQLLE